MTPRLHLDLPLAAGELVTLPAGSSRHVQVLRLQPGSVVTLFNGAGGEWSARIVHIGRREVQVEIGEHDAVDREAARRITLAVGMPANERMDALIEKATELGAACIQPLLCERSVLRLAGERAQKRVEHWRGIAVAASEQSGRTRVPQIGEVMTLRDWFGTLSDDGSRFVLSLREARPFAPAMAGDSPLFLSGPEGGLAEAEEAMAVAAGFVPVSLGPRTLRADTAPLAATAALTLLG